MKACVVRKFCDAIDGSFAHAKVQFANLVELKLNDSEIEMVASAFSAQAKHSNQLTCLFTDPLTDEHKKRRTLSEFSNYRDALQKKILDRHSSGKLKINKKGEWNYAIE